MKKLVYIFLFIISYTTYSQSLSVFDVDTTNFPIIKAKYYAFDVYGYPMYNLSPSHFSITENGQSRQVTKIICPEPKASSSLSSVLVMDISFSMKGSRLDIAKIAANQWIDMQPTSESECAITSFSDINYLNQDFTVNKSLLHEAVNSLDCQRGTNYNAALIEPMAGGILIAKPGKFKKVLVFLTDGGPNYEPNTIQIIKEAKENNIIIYCVCVNMGAPQCLKDMAEQTGGLYFEKVSTLEEITGCYSRIFMISQGVTPCEIEWLSRSYCDLGRVDVGIKLKTNGTRANVYYERPKKALAVLDVNPKLIKFKDIVPGITIDTTITVFANNSDIYVSKIISSNSAFLVSPSQFSLKSGESKELTLSFTPSDRSYQFTEITFINDICDVSINSIGGYRSKKQIEKTLKLTQPNGKDVYVIGTDSLITWEGVFPTDPVLLEYSIDNGTNWNFLNGYATGLSYIWKDISKPPSTQCLVRITADLKSLSQCDEGELTIYNQNWMCANLDVTRYRNGDVIPQITDPTQWKNLKSGAWCYYNNEPSKGEIYGKLYNLYAVMDPRGLAPEGWHIPTSDEWSELAENLGGFNVAGGKLKCIGTKESGLGLWRAPNTGATNESDFSALPSGYRTNSGNFNDNEMTTYWWSSTISDTARATARYLNYSTPYLYSNTSHKNNGFSVRCINDKLIETIQIDTSDAVFTIAAPKAEVKDIDMKQSLVGRARDSIITDFIINIGQCKFSVDSIYVRTQSKDSCAFFLVTGLPKYTVSAGSSHFVELRFIPLRVGSYNAELVVITQSDTLIAKIIGEGVKPYITVQNKVINFGKVAMGYAKDSNQVITIKNISDSKIHITHTKHNKPNDYDFTKGNGGAFDLDAHETKQMDLSFSPSAVGRTVGSLEFHYNGLGSPAIVQLYGVGVELIPQTLVSPVNDTINIPIDKRLFWNLNVGQTSYTLQVSKNIDFADLVIDTSITDTVFDCPKLDFFQTYYWRVKPGYQAKQSIWSPIWRFTTMMDTVELVSPTSFSKFLDINLNMNWEHSKYNKDYRLQISEDNKFKSKFSDSLLFENSLDIMNLYFYSEYFWRVRNESGDSLGYWSNIWQFKTRMSDIFLIYPENTQSGLGNEINFKWSKVIGAQYYQLQISKNNKFTDIVYSRDSITISEQYVPDLENDVLYYWRVRVWNEECVGSEYWSDVWTYRTSSSSVYQKSEFSRIIPNPAGDFITIIINTPDTKVGYSPDIYIYNTLGEKMMFVESEIYQSVMIDISTLPNGMYFVKIGDEVIKFFKL